MLKKVFVIAVVSICFAVFNASVNAQRPRASVSASEVNGTFRMKLKNDSSNEVKILALGKGKLRVAFDLLYPYKTPGGELTANMGTLDGEANINGDTAIYESNDFGPCKIIIKFVRPGTIKVTQNGTDFECGFGHNVTAAGSYRRVSTRKPKFDEQR